MLAIKVDNVCTSRCLSTEPTWLPPMCRNATSTSLLERFLNTLDEGRRAVFAMAELEDMAAPENTRAGFVAFLEAEGDPYG